MSSFTTDSVSDSPSRAIAPPVLAETLRAAPTKEQLALIDTCAGQGEAGYQVLWEVLLDWRDHPVNEVMGKIYQVLAQTAPASIQNQLLANWPDGLVPLISAKGIDYSPIQELLVAQDYEAADRLTLQKLCELAGGSAVRRKWLYFTEVNSFPVADLLTVDRLWRVYSEGKFGFSVQRELWLGVKRDWDKLWPKIDWKSGNRWTRYPNGFTWDLSAPRGHLPLSNQLRGVRVMESLLSHPAWQTP